VTRALLALIALALACGERAGEPGAPEAAPAPRAAVVIEPPRLRVGDVAHVEVAVVTPPDHAVAPLHPPDPAALGPLWLLDAEALEVERQGARWTHRTRLRVRAREVGAGEFPALRVEVVGPEGARSELVTEPRRFEVVSVLPSYPERVAPFSYRLPEPPAGGLSALGAAAAGAAGALGALAVVAAVRRGRRGAALRRAAALPAAEPPWRAALAELELAAAAIDTDWRRSADRAGQALRGYVARRFGWPVDRCTTEELTALAPPFALALRWLPVVPWLRALDELRFRPGSEPDAPAQVARLTAEIARWVRDTVPPEAAR
jgi:hypothetical protein